MGLRTKWAKNWENDLISEECCRHFICDYYNFFSLQSPATFSKFVVGKLILIFINWKKPNIYQAALGREGREAVKPNKTDRHWLSGQVVHQQEKSRRGAGSQRECSSWESRLFRQFSQWQCVRLTWKNGSTKAKEKFSIFLRREMWLENNATCSDQSHLQDYLIWSLYFMRKAIGQLPGEGH